MIKKILYYCTTFLGIIILHVAVKKYAAVFGVSPNIIFIVVVFAGLLKGSVYGQVLGFGLGLFSDTFLINLFGANAFCFTLCGFISGLMKKKLDASQTKAQAAFVFIISLFYSVCFLAINSVFSSQTNEFSLKNLWLLPIVNAISAPIIFEGLKKWLFLWFPQAGLKNYREKKY